MKFKVLLKMNKEITSSSLALRLWLISALALALGITIYFFISEIDPFIIVFLFVSLISAVAGSLPAFVALTIFQPLIQKFFNTYRNKIAALFFLFFLIALVYGFLGGLIDNNPFSRYSSFQSFFSSAAICAGFVFASSIISFFINIQYINIYFQSPYQKIYIMEENLSHSFVQPNQSNQSTKLWVKGLITAGLILLMLIPTVFVQNLVEERQARQLEVKNEVSSKWAGQQNITFPYLFIPYIDTLANKTLTAEKSFIILPENLNVAGSVSTEQRKRSIYSVLLYNSSLNAKGNFKIQLPEGVDASSINWSGAKICFGISDFKGIEQKITTQFNNINYDLSAGLPSNDLDSNGLSSPVTLTADNIGKQISFEMPLKIKGTDQLTLFSVSRQ